MPRSLATRLGLVFAVAVLVRLGYQAALLAAGGTNQMPDTRRYVEIGRAVLATGWPGYLDGAGLSPLVDFMPLYGYFLAGVMALTGGEHLWAVSAAQAVLDGLTVVAITLIARAIDPRLTWVAAAVACVWPPLVVYSSFVLTETLFVALLAWGLWACIRAATAERRTGWLVAAGILFGLALNTRPILQYFPIVLLPTLAYLLRTRAGLTLSRALLCAAIPAALCLLAAVPRYVQTYGLYGTPVFSTQTGEVMLNWFYPCLRTPVTCGDRAAVERENEAVVEQRLAALGPAAAGDLVLRDRVRRTLAIELVLALPPARIAAGYAAGAAKLVFQTVFTELGEQFGLRRADERFSANPELSYRERVVVFVSSIGRNWFMVVWLTAQVGVLVVRMIQAGGLVAAVREPSSGPVVVFLLVTALYFLAINGPMGYAKYRLPMEPALVVFFALGLERAWRRWRRAAIAEPARMAYHPVA